MRCTEGQCSVECNIQECLDELGAHSTVRWAVTNKEAETHLNVGATLVTKHIGTKHGGNGMDDITGAMPPFELSKMISAKSCATTPREI